MEDLFKPAAVIFDKDGLMLDTERPIAALWKVAGKTFGWNITDEVIYRTLGTTAEGTRAVYMNEFGPEFPIIDIVNELRRLEAEVFKGGIDHKAGLLPLLDFLRSIKMPIAVATSSGRASALRDLEKAGILDRFAAIACGDEAKNGKPAPDIFLLAAERLGVSPEACVGFEDSAAGLKGLHAAGIRSVFIKDMILPPDEILSTVWKRYENLEEAIELFKF